MSGSFKGHACSTQSEVKITVIYVAPSRGGITKKQEVSGRPPEQQVRTLKRMYFAQPEHLPRPLNTSIPASHSITQGAPLGSGRSTHRLTPGPADPLVALSVNAKGISGLVQDAHVIQPDRGPSLSQSRLPFPFGL